jgi:type II secretory pathway predicted ATPase ExeA
MYESYYGLHEQAFRKTPDPRYLYLNETYEEALEQLVFTVTEMELALLTGEIGAGKTLLSRVLIDRIGDRYEVGMILNPRLSPRQFLRAIAIELGVDSSCHEFVELLDQIQRRLLDLEEADRRAVLIIDEAHLIPGKATFEEIRLLTNYCLDDRNLIAVLLLGQPELRRRLQRRAYRALTQRIGAQFHLTAFTLEDTTAYITHRLKIAGASRPLFTQEAIASLHSAARGVPRVINQLATQCLLEGMAREAPVIVDDIVKSVNKDHVYSLEAH